MEKDPESILHEIRSIQQELVALQQQVIQGKIPPQDYQRRERENVERIHVLEAELAAATGQSEPERHTR